MAYTYDDFLDAVNSAGMMGNFSSYDLNLAKENPAAGMGILSAKQHMRQRPTRRDAWPPTKGRKKSGQQAAAIPAAASRPAQA